VAGVTAATLLERTEELERIGSALTDARAGTGRLVVVEGPPGMGKTALLAAARNEAAEAGMRVLRSRGTELEQDFAFGVVRQLFEPVLADASDDERAELIQGAVAGSATLFAPTHAAADTVTRPDIDPAFAILHGLYWLAANIAATSPLCLVVDDAHWADASSLRYLAFLITRLEELPIALVVATRPNEPGADPRLLATVTADPSADVIPLPPLTSGAVFQLIQARWGAEPEVAFVDACRRATRGTPFLLGELLHALADERVPPTAEGARDVERVGARTVARSIRLRLERLPDPARLLAGALAILEESDLRFAAQLAGLEHPDAVDGAELLGANGIVAPGRPLTFAHPIVRSAIYEGLSAAERAQGHRRAAELLAEPPGPVERVAEHLLSSEPAGEAWVVDRLVEAARTARAQGAPELEAIYLRRAVAEPPPVEEQGELLLELGVAEASAGLDGWAEHLERAVDSAPDPTSAALAGRALARALYRAQRVAEAVHVLDRGAAALGHGESELALELESAAVVVGMHHLVVSPSTARRRATLRAQATADPTAPAELLAGAAFVSVLSNEPAEVAAELALTAEARVAGLPDTRSTAPALFVRTAPTLVWAERWTEALPLLDAAIADARATGNSGLLAISLASRGLLSLRQGELSAAEADSRTALAATELPAPPMYRMVNVGVLVESLVEQGELAAAEAVLAPFAPEPDRSSLVASALRYARGMLLLELGAVDEGVEELLAAGALLTHARVTTPAYRPWRSSAAIGLLSLGQRESAECLADEELELARAFGAPGALAIAQRGAGVVRGGDRGEELLRAAVTSAETAGARLERARALTDLGAQLRRRNRRSEARELLREALDVATRIGAKRLAERAETELRATGARPRRIVLTGVESLTASERRIAEFAGQGLTNREIAQMLFITTRTVEGHLTSVFRKLRLDSRSELAGALGERAPVSA
jgi:DNA-binding CsgD family transcriptional regulator